jgi:hypothetical protein
MSRSTVASAFDSEQRQTARLHAYQELSKSHAAIVDFRGKLLTLLPLASGTGIFFLLDSGSVARGDARLVAVGLFGAAVTCGLLLYELRGIQDCVLLRVRGRQLEEHLGISESESQFARIDGKLHSLVDEVGAGWVVYVSVFVSWLFVASYGLDLGHSIWVACLGVLTTAYVGALLAYWKVRAWLLDGTAATGP